MPFFQFKGKRVAYYTIGSGQPLVLLHGFCEDSAIWDDFIAELPDYKIIRVDIAGFGASDLPDENTVDMAAQTVKAALDHLGVGRCILIGHSLGGYTAAAFAHRYPEALKGLGMFHSHPFADSESKKTERERAIAFVRRNGHILYVKQMIPKLFAELFVSSNSFLINSLILKATTYKPEAIIGAQEAMINRPDRSQAIAALACPVLFIIGKQDTVVSYEVSLRQTHLAEVADIHILPKVAHMGMFRSKIETARIIRNFVGFCNDQAA